MYPKGVPGPVCKELSVPELNEDLVRARECKRMVFLAAICGKSLRRVVLPCDAHVMSASSDGIRQPCFRSRRFLNLCRTFLIDLHFCAGNSLGARYYCDARGCTRRVHTSFLESSRPLETRTVLADIDPGSLIAGQIENALCSEVVVQINRRRGTRVETPHLRSFLGSYRPAKDSAKHQEKSLACGTISLDE